MKENGWEVNNVVKKKKKMTQAQDDAYDRRHGIKEGSKRDIAQDRRNGIMDKKKHKVVKAAKKTSMIAHKGKKKAVLTTGAFGGKPKRLVRGGKAIPGQSNYLKDTKKKSFLKRVTKGAVYK